MRLICLVSVLALAFAGPVACGDSGDTTVGSGGGTGTADDTAGGDGSSSDAAGAGGGTDSGGATDTGGGTGPGDASTGGGTDDTSGGGSTDATASEDTTGGGGTDDTTGGVTDTSDNFGHPLPTTAAYGTPCEQNSRIGHFQVTHDETGGFAYSAVTGTVAEGVIPLTILQLVEEVGDCKLMQKVNPFCDPPCTAGQLCDHGGQCIPYPANVNVGDVTVTGLAESPIIMEPNSSTYYTKVGLPFPVYEATDQVDLVAAGADASGFALRAWGVTSMALPAVVHEMFDGEDLKVDWVAEAGPWKVVVSVNVDQHGNSPVTLVCETDDTGSYTIAGSLVTKLLDFGVSGFATLRFRRATVDSLTHTLGCIQLSVESLILGKLQVAGHTPCKFDPDCPEGQVCETAIETCVDH